MRSKRYSVILADRSSGVVRRFTIRLAPTLALVSALFALPILVGMGLRWSGRAEAELLRSTTATLEIENASYRAATEALTGQIASLQAAVTDLGVRSTLDPSSARAISKLPAVVTAGAVGGATGAAEALFPRSMLSPEDTFGVLRDLLEGLESRLTLVRRDVERREALAAATPSIWPAHGWLSAGYGQRKDPFNGQPDFHGGLDISADKGRPVYATAAGRVEIAAYTGDYGNLVVLNHGFGLITRYGHLSRSSVKAGERVARGHVLGYIGSTGRATGSHLHYEVLANGKLLNPLQLLFSKPRP